MKGTGLSGGSPAPALLPRRKTTRLSGEVYRQGGVFFLTTKVRNRRRAFSNGDAVSLCLSVLNEAAAESGVEVDTYCFMPDHVHLLITAQEGTEVSRFMYRFKQASAFRCNRAFGWKGPFWQGSYHDHVIRRSEDAGSVRAYILANPLRAGMVEDLEDYPFSGCPALRED